MKTLRMKQEIKNDGEIHVTGLPCKKGDNVELILLIENDSGKPPLTARKLLNSEIIGMWSDRSDIIDSSEYARRLREMAEKRKIE